MIFMIKKKEVIGREERSKRLLAAARCGSQKKIQYLLDLGTEADVATKVSFSFFGFFFVFISFFFFFFEIVWSLLCVVVVVKVNLLSVKVKK